jgi:hypothetical protein
MNRREFVSGLLASVALPSVPLGTAGSSRCSAEEREIIAICQQGNSEPLTESWIEMCLEQARSVGSL